MDDGIRGVAFRCVLVNWDALGAKPREGALKDGVGTEIAADRPLGRLRARAVAHSRGSGPVRAYDMESCTRQCGELGRSADGAIGGVRAVRANDDGLEHLRALLGMRVHMTVTD